MTFGAMAAWQAWLFIAASVAAAILVFRVKVRPPRVVVPSLVVWRQILDEVHAQTWWERVRRAVSLALTALIALALAAAVTRPSPRFGGATRGRLLVVLDASWSMRTKNADGSTRWQRAVAQSRALIQSSGSDDVVLATTADGLVEGPTSDRALLETAFARLSPSGGEGTAWPRMDDVVATHFFTDGAVARSLDPAVIVHSVFEPAPNVAITAFVARPATSSTVSGEAYLEVSNYAPIAQQVHVTVVRGTARIVDRDVQVGAGDALREVVPLDAQGGPGLAAHVTAARNALDVDDDAVAWLGTADPVSVTVVSDSPATLASLLKHDPMVRATFVTPATYKADNADVVIFDRWLPDVPPVHPVFAIAPPAKDWLGRTGPEELTPHWVASSEHPVLDGVDPFTLEIARVRTFQSAGLVPIAVSEHGTPIVSVLDSPKTRAVVLGFAVADSNLASTPAFPVLIGNALEWLAHPASGEPRSPGPMPIAVSTTRVTDPDGADVAIVRAGDRALVDLRKPGLYLVDAGGSRRVVGVNVGAPDVANVMRTNLAGSSAVATGLMLGGRAWWMYAIVLALVLLLVEWATWQRRVTV